MRTSMLSWATAAAAIFALVSTPVFVGAQEEDGVRFQPPGHDFSVSLPTAPGHKVRSTSTVIGDVDTDVWSLKSNGTDYSIAITDLPSVALWFNDAEDLIEKARKAMLEELSAKQANLRNFVRGHFTEELDYLIPARNGQPPQKGRAWFALIDDKLVVLSAQVAQDKAAVLDAHFSRVKHGRSIARR